MSCCPNVGGNCGQPFDPDEEGPSPEDVKRFGEDTEYSEFADEDPHGSGSGPVWGEPGAASASRGGILKAVGVPAVAAVVVVAFVLVYVI